MTYQIKSNKKVIDYSVEGIKKGSKHTQDERRQLLIQIVQNNPQILHTHVIQIAYSLCKVAKKTIEKELSRLEEDGLLQSTKLSDSPNGLRMWEVSKPEMPIEKEFKSKIELLFSDLEKYVKEFENLYPALPLQKKINGISFVLTTLRDVQPILIITSKTIEIERNKKWFQALLDSFYDVILRDFRYQFVIPVLRDNLVPRALKSVDELKEFTKFGYPKLVQR